MGELGALFNPGMRHEIEERESKQNRREEEGNARDGDLRIDLSSGIAVINLPSRAKTEVDTTGEESAAGPALSRTVGDRPDTRRSARRPASAASAAQNPDKSAARAAAKSADSDAKEQAVSTGPTPSSKASRSAR